MLRRAAFAELADTTEVAVEQLWCTAPQGTALDALDVVRGLDATAQRLVLGQPITAFPRWGSGSTRSASTNWPR